MRLPPRPAKPNPPVKELIYDYCQITIPEYDSKTLAEIVAELQEKYDDPIETNLINFELRESSGFVDYGDYYIQVTYPKPYTIVNKYYDSDLRQYEVQLDKYRKKEEEYEKLLTSPEYVAYLASEKAKKEGRAAREDKINRLKSELAELESGQL